MFTCSLNTSGLSDSLYISGWIWKVPTQKITRICVVRTYRGLADREGNECEFLKLRILPSVFTG